VTNKTMDRKLHCFFHLHLLLLSVVHFVGAVNSPPEIVQQPQPSYEIVDGTQVVLACRVFGMPKPVVKWMHGGQELTGGRYIIHENGDLEIRSALFSDNGHYQCAATNTFGEARSGTDVGFVKVFERTRISAHPTDSDVPAGQSAIFRCNANADSNLTLSIDWLRNGQLIDFDQEPNLVTAADYSLTILNTSMQDSGTYTCLARTRLDNATTSAMLIVQDIPNPLHMVNCSTLDCPESGDTIHNS